MRNLLTLLLLAILSWSFHPNQAFTQDEEPNTYLVVDYMKVKPGMGQEYLEMEAVWKKLHTARIDAGKTNGWAVLEILMPYGANNEYNFVTVQLYKGEKQLSNYFDGTMMEGADKILSKEEWAVVEHTLKLRDMVKTEVWQMRSGASADDWKEGTIQIFNFFALKEGKMGWDHGKVENEIWLPIHQLRIDDDLMEGWGLYSLDLPYGASLPYDDATIDFYSSMEQYLAPYDWEAYTKKAHPEGDMDEMWKKTQEIVSLELAEIRRVVDSVGFE